jgi:hypothetical protein
MRKFLVILILLVLIGCVREVKLVDFNDGTTIIGEYNKATKTVTITLPSGEVLKGEYVALTNATIGYGSLFYGANVGSMLSVGTGGSSNGYALLTGDKGTVMEIIFSYSEWTGHGFGTARTNKGTEYRVMF